MRDDIERLEDILEAIEKIEKYTRGDRSAFDSDERTQVWVVYHLEILGEAANNISVEIQQTYPHTPWGEMIGMRNVLAHQYFGIDLDIVWQVVRHDLSRIKLEIVSILSELSD